jgi:hypothetical protein
MFNNFPLKLIESIFLTIDDIDLKFHFYVIILKKGSSLSTISKFLILPKGLFYSHIRSNLWINLCDKFMNKFLMVLENFKIIKNFNYGLILILLTYYLNKIINLKLNNYINILKFYSKEERLDSIGNYFKFSNISFKLYCKNFSKIPKTEYYFNYLIINDYYFFNLELKFYSFYFNNLTNQLINFDYFFEFNK